VIKDKIKKSKTLKGIVSSLKRKGKRVVFTNGCFDILHLGHIKYLEKAAALGERLIVAVNSDSSVRKIKGSPRPIMPAKERAILVAACECVDYVVIFSEATPLGLIKALRPSILVKGGDWQKSDIVGSDIVEAYGGRVVRIKFIKSYSSSSIIARIKER
jgi:D-beta-D-heptose 7-phosphate kinase/D-beta-D-heptose 1-phosphate adenosyltransferase